MLTATVKLSGIFNSIGLSVALARNSDILRIRKKGMTTSHVVGETIFQRTIV